MSKLSKLILIIFVFLIITPIFLTYKISKSHAVDAVPELLLSCTETRPNEFNTLRPYQAAPCGEAPAARFCSNRLIIFEEFNMAGEGNCHESNCSDCEFPCEPNYQVDAHNLNITLDESEFPIMGNTEDKFDDATKVNEYASWYLSGLDSNGGKGAPTTDQIVNYSGPLNKLLPGAIADAQRIKTLESIEVTKTYKDSDTGETVTDADNHNQYVVCGKKEIQLIPSWLTNMFGVGAIGLGRTIPTPCYENSKYRLSHWDETLIDRLYQEIQQWLLDHPFYPPTFINKLIASATLEHWAKKTPPLPWDDGTGKPFTSSNRYIKAYKEWQGDLCILIPLPDMFNSQILGGNEIPFCVGIPGVTSSEYADLFPYIPLSNNSDKKGKNVLLTADGPNYVAYSGTVITDAKHESYLNAPLYFAHTQEVYELSSLLNKTFAPKDTCFSDCMAVEGNTAGECNISCEKSALNSAKNFPDDVEKLKKGLGETTYVYDPANPSTDPYDYLDCTAVNVRTNEGDNLFPGDRPGKPNDKELFVKGAQYLITQATCHEKNEWEMVTDGCTYPNGEKYDCKKWKREFRCPAGVGIEFKLGTETPWANQIFSNTVAGTQSTFRKIFPKVSEEAPVNCIADIPTTTGVEYSIENDLNEKPNGGSQRLGKESIPADGASGMELTFSHVGSVYEYFLHGIQTALRPKGYGYPIANGNCTPSTPITCGDWETKLGDSGGACGICNAPIGELAKKILTAAGTAFNVPASSVWAAMKHEGADWPEFQGQFTDENVRKWSTPVECGGEPMPGCDPNDKSSSKSFAPFGFLPYWFYKGNSDIGLWAAVQKFDPTRNSIDTVSHCNFLDAAFAASKNLQLFSGFSRTPSSCYGYNMASGVRPGSCSTDSKNWSDDKIVQSHVGYWIGITPWCPDGTGGPMPPDLGNNTPLPNYARDVLSNFKSAKCN